MRLKLLATLLGCVAMQGCVNPIGLVTPIPHSGDAIHAHVVDSVTGQPLSDVLVLAVWKDWTPGVFGGSIEQGPPPHCVGLVNLQSVITDVNGTFLLPAWSHFGHCAGLEGGMPKIYFYKPSYELLKFQNNSDLEFGTTASYYSTEELDGKIVKLQPLGPHYFDNLSEEDKQVAELWKLDRTIREILYTVNSSSDCFWSQLRPAMLMLVQEKRRLSGYIPSGVQYLDDDLVTGRYDRKVSCGDQGAYVHALTEEAQDTKPDVMRLPTVIDAHDFQHPDIRMGSLSTDNFSSSTVANRELADTGVTYHVQVDPLNPGYMTVTMVLPSVQQILQEYALTQRATGVQTQRLYQQNRDYGYQCFDFTGETGCRWVVAFLLVGHEPNHDLTVQRSSVPTYEFIEGRWSLKPTMFIRPLVTAPEFIEIDGPDALSITTDLERVAPRLWRLPERTVSYSMTIESPQVQQN